MSNLDTKMTALADEIRELSGTTTSKGVDEMTTDIDAANTEIAEQAELLAQITTALEGKASGSGGVSLPELDNPATANDILGGKEAIDGAGNKITGTIATKTSSNLTASGATVTVPAGYYASQSTKSVATATQATPSISIDSNGKITATATQTAGYVSAGTKTGTKQMTTQAAKTVTPSTSSQTAVAKNVYTTGAVTVAAIPSNYEDVGAETTEYTSLASELESVINSLPEAGGGGSSSELEWCNVTIARGMTPPGVTGRSCEVWAITQSVGIGGSIIPDYTQTTVMQTETKEITVLKNSLLIIFSEAMGDCSGPTSDFDPMFSPDSDKKPFLIAYDSIIHVGYN